MGTFNVIITGLTVILTILSRTLQILCVRVRERGYYLFTISAIMRSQSTSPPTILTRTAFSPGLLNYIVPHKPLNLPNKHSLQGPDAVLSTAERISVKFRLCELIWPMSAFLSLFFSAYANKFNIHSNGVCVCNMKNLNWFFIGLLLNLNLNRPAED